MATHAAEIIDEAWLARVLEVEDSERQRRSLKRRTDNAGLGAVKPLPDSDFRWPSELDRALLGAIDCGRSLGQCYWGTQQTAD